MKRIILATAILAVCFNVYALDTGDLTVRGDVELSKYTTNGFLKTTGGTGTVAVDSTGAYLLTDGSNASAEVNIGTSRIHAEAIGLGGVDPATWSSYPIYMERSAWGGGNVALFKGTGDNKFYLCYDAFGYPLFRMYKDPSEETIRLDAGGYSVSWFIEGLLIGTTSEDFHPNTAPFVVKGKTADGSSNVQVWRDSNEILIGSLDTDGNLWISGTATIGGGVGGYVKIDQSTPETITGGTPIIEQNLKFQTSVYATGAKAGVTTMVSTATSIAGAYLSYGMIQKDLDDPSDQAGELQDGVQGQMVTIQLLTKAAGNYVLTPTRKTGYTTLTFDTAKDSITLLYLDGTSGWIIVGNNGVTVN